MNNNIKIIIGTLVISSVIAVGVTFLFNTFSAKKELEKQVKELTAEIEELQSSKDLAENKLATTETKLASAEEKIKSLEGTMSDKEKAIAEANKKAQGAQGALSKERSNRGKACERVALEASQIILRATCLYIGEEIPCRLPEDIRQTAIAYGNEVYNACIQ